MADLDYALMVQLQGKYDGMRNTVCEPDPDYPLPKPEPKFTKEQMDAIDNALPWLEWCTNRCGNLLKTTDRYGICGECLDGR